MLKMKRSCMEGCYECMSVSERLQINKLIGSFVLYESVSQKAPRPSVLGSLYWPRIFSG